MVAALMVAGVAVTMAIEAVLPGPAWMWCLAFGLVAWGVEGRLITRERVKVGAIVVACGVFVMVCIVVIQKLNGLTSLFSWLG